MRNCLSLSRIAAASVMLIMINISTAGNLDKKPKGQYTTANIYYVPWDLLTRSRLNVDAIRSTYRIKISIVDEHETMMLVSWLELNKLRPASNAKESKYENDPRLVIDLYKGSNYRETYFASSRNLLTEDGSLIRPIDNAFKNKFHF